MSIAYSGDNLSTFGNHTQLLKILAIKNITVASEEEGGPNEPILQGHYKIFYQCHGLEGICVSWIWCSFIFLLKLNKNKHSVMEKFLKKNFNALVWDKQDLYKLIGF